MKFIKYSFSIVALSVVLDSCNNEPGQNEKPDTVVKHDTLVPPVENNNEDQLGTITGALSYPSDAGIPADYMVAAMNTETGEVITASMKDFDLNSNTYSLKVSPGKYHVYSYLLNAPDERAYYDEFVMCGMSVKCHSHEKLVVEVNAGEKVVNIDPADWYNY